jgi:hypothetical protein
MTAPPPQHARVSGTDSPSASTESMDGDQYRPGESTTLLQNPSNIAQNAHLDRTSKPQHFTLRSVLVGLVLGIIFCFSSMYFGLQTGWVDPMGMASSLIGFAFFKAFSRQISYPFTPVENVLVQSVAGSVAAMPLGCGFVGVIPALNYLLTPEENGPLDIGLWKLIVWAVGVCFFGVIFVVPLRREFIIKEKLKFPTGTATATMIGVLHGDNKNAGLIKYGSEEDTYMADEEEENLVTPISPNGTTQDERPPHMYPGREENSQQDLGLDQQSDWEAKVRLLIISFTVSAFYVCILC